MKGSIKTVCGVLLLFMVTAASASADPRLDAFIAKFETFWPKARNSEYWKFRETPWTTFSKHRISDSIPTHLMPDYIAAQDRGDCKSVLRMDREAFLLHYPYMAPAMVRDDVDFSFSEHFVRRLSNGYRRCSNLSSLRRHQNELRNSNIDPPPFVLTSSKKKQRSKMWGDNGDWDDLEGRRNWALKFAVIQAVCDEYKPALEDVLKFTKQPDLLILAPELEYYALVLMAELGIRSYGIAKRIDRVTNGLDPDHRKRIRAAALYGDLGLAKIPDWRCSGPRVEPYNY